ncbi:MAG: PKD domain-containing protein [Bacteroidia bacterium]|nr:PKD domain-containing protein [Bacteroidia bacterium]
MKNKILLNLLVISLCTSQSFAQCQSNFTWQQTSNNVIAFTNTSTGTTISTSYLWNLGNGNYAYSQNPVYTYNVPGTYNVCLTIQDSNSCNSTFCTSVTVTGILICNMNLTFTSTIANCSSCSDGTATVYANNATAPYTYNWQTSPPQTTASATGLSPGTYTCCVTDANACTACNTVNVIGSVCQAGFTWLQTANNIITFTNTSAGAPPNIVYNWNFGNNQYGSTQNPVHFYTTPGTYNVCLTLFDTSASCSSSFCSAVTVTGLNCNNLTLTVSAVQASCPTCNNGSAAANFSGGTPPYSFLWSTSQTTQNISNLLPGNYTCTITDAIGCTASASALVNSSGGCSAYFTVAPAGPPQTYTAVNFATGSPPLSYVWNWGDNTYSFIAFPTHTYAVAGYYTICLSITDALACQSLYCDSFYIARLENYSAMVTITVVSPLTAINNYGLENVSSFFPNPFSHQAVISFSQELSEATFRLFNLYGQLVQEKNNISGKEIILTRETLGSGVYVYEVTEKEKKICGGKAVVY